MSASNSFLDTTEVDPGNRIVRTSPSVITFTALPANENNHCYWDDGAGKWSGDLVHETETHPTSNNGVSGLVLPWVLANAIGSWTELDISDDRVGSRYHQGDTTAQFYLIEIYDSTGYSDFTAVTLTRNIPYYSTQERSGLTLTKEIYDDEAKTSLVDTLTLTLQSVVAYQYRYPISTNNLGTTPSITGTVENFNANDAAVFQAAWARNSNQIINGVI